MAMIPVTNARWIKAINFRHWGASTLNIPKAMRVRKAMFWGPNKLIIRNINQDLSPDSSSECLAELLIHY